LHYAYCGSEQKWKRIILKVRIMHRWEREGGKRKKRKKQNKTKQNKTKQNKTKQNKTKQNKKQFPTQTRIVFHYSSSSTIFLRVLLSFIPCSHVWSTEGALNRPRQAERRIVRPVRTRNGKYSYICSYRILASLHTSCIQCISDDRVKKERDRKRGLTTRLPREIAL
jgi:hypothetical protein